MRCILLFVITEKILELSVYFDKFQVSVLNCQSIIEELEEIFELQIYRIKRKKVNNKQKLTVKDGLFQNFAETLRKNARFSLE